MVAAVFLLTAGAPVQGAVTPQDDAGSGQDAPDEPVPEVWIVSGESYRGTQEGVPFDRADHYAFEADAGQTINARASGPVGCFDILDEDGEALTGANCALGMVELSEITITAPYTGTYYFLYTYIEPQVYFFSLGVDEAAPNPAPVSTSAFGSGDTLPPVTPASQDDEHVVVAVVDTGVNPYHEQFRASGLADHPSTWLDGFPSDAQSVELTLDGSDYQTALQADAGTWDGLSYSGPATVQGTQDEHLYTFPGTRIVAGISFGEFDSAVQGGGGSTPVLDEHGHGSGSAALAGGSGLDLADGNVLIVAVEVANGDFEDGLWWAARQPWIDAVTVSLGTVANVPLPPLLFGGEDAASRATKLATDNGKPVLFAAGNGFSGSGLAPDHCSTHTSDYTGPSWVTRIGAAEPRTGNPSTWHCLPVDAIARTPAPSASHTSTVDQDDHSGTSAATPNVAGHLAHLLLEARRQGLAVEPQEALDHLLHAAQPADPAVAPFAEPSLPAPASVVDQGYGLVDEESVDRGLGTLVAGDGPTPRPVEDAFFAADDAVRDALWGEAGVFVDPAGATSEAFDQDDAGSGQDAPDQPPSDIVVEPDTVYEGAFTGLLADHGDVYALDLEAGDSVTVAYEGELLCLDVWRPSGEEHDTPASCTWAGLRAELTFTADVTGTWFIDLGYPVPNTYSFGYGIDGPAPELGV